MFVFEEPECVTVEFCRTHYGHDVNNKEKKSKVEVCGSSKSNNICDENSLNYEIIDSYSKLNSFLSKSNRATLINILYKNQYLLEETELIYENEEGIVLKIPYTFLKKLLEEEGSKIDENKEDNKYISETSEENKTVLLEGGELCYDEITIEKLDDEETDSENSTILKSLGNGIFLDPTSNKRLKLDFKEKKQSSSVGTSNVQENRKKDREKNNIMLVKEYLNEFDETVYILEPIKDEETVVQKREKILSQLQAILMMVNSEDDMDVLDDIQNHLSKYAIPE